VSTSRHDEPGSTAGGPREGPLDRGPGRHLARHRGAGARDRRQEEQEEVVARDQVREEAPEGGGGAGLAARGPPEEALLVEHLRGAAVAKVRPRKSLSSPPLSIRYRAQRNFDRFWRTWIRGVAFERIRFVLPLSARQFRQNKF
jgi:hypothetical protein